MAKKVKTREDAKPGPNSIPAEIKNKAMLDYTVRGMRTTDIAEKYGVTVAAVSKWSKDGSWRLLKLDEDEMDTSEATIEYISDAIDAYKFFRQRALELGKACKKSAELKQLVEIVSICDKQTVEWLNLKGDKPGA